MSRGSNLTLACFSAFSSQNDPFWDYDENPIVGWLAIVLLNSHIQGISFLPHPALILSSFCTSPISILEPALKRCWEKDRYARLFVFFQQGGSCLGGPAFGHCLPLKLFSSSLPGTLCPSSTSSNVVMLAWLRKNLVFNCEVFIASYSIDTERRDPTLFGQQRWILDLWGGHVDM